MVDWREALESVVARTRHERFRALCADDHPDREAWRQQVISMATGEPPAVPNYPTPVVQANNLARSLWAWAVDGFRVASDEEQARRRSICATCAEWVPADRRCRICGCHTDAKIALRTAQCPLPEPRW